MKRFWFSLGWSPSSSADRKRQAPLLQEQKTPGTKRKAVFEPHPEHVENTIPAFYLRP